MMIEHNESNQKIVKLLQYAIASNTLNFTAPSTTSFDKKIYKTLQELSAVRENDIDEMFKHRCYDSVLHDTKFFDYRRGRVAIAQIELYGLSIDGGNARAELNRLKLDNNLLFSILNVVDIKNKRSMVVFSSGITDAEASEIFDFNVNNGIYQANRILLRKTDFIPAMTS